MQQTRQFSSCSAKIIFLSPGVLTLWAQIFKVSPCWLVCHIANMWKWRKFMSLPWTWIKWNIVWVPTLASINYSSHLENITFVPLWLLLDIAPNWRIEHLASHVEVCLCPWTSAWVTRCPQRVLVAWIEDLNHHYHPPLWTSNFSTDHNPFLELYD